MTLSDHSTPSKVSPSRLARLARGINASHWFAQAHHYTPSYFQSYFTLEDVRLIRELGFGHIRFTLNPEILLNEQSPDVLNQEMLGYVDEALTMMVGEGLAVIVDLHPEDHFKHRLNRNPIAVQTFTTFWKALAAHLAPRDPDTLFLEVLNEPILADAQAWAAIQRTLLAAMREGAPYHTLIATGHRWSEIPELLELEPVDDPNVVYNFHCYEPHIFTHQGATWGVPYWEQLRRVPYPAHSDTIEALLPTLTDEEAKAGLTRYREGEWNKGKMTAWIRQAAAWGQQYHVPLTCNEFGVYRAKSLPEHRLAWLNDVRSALESYGIGWTMWDYAGGFSVVNTIEGRRVADAGTVEALGLNREVVSRNGTLFSALKGRG